MPAENYAGAASDGERSDSPTPFHPSVSPTETWQRPVDDEAREALSIGERITATVTGIADYGVFVATQDGLRGLVHISEISDWFVEDARDYFYIGEEFDAEVISREEGTGKYAFSTRRLGGKKPIGEDYARTLMALHNEGLAAPEPRRRTGSGRETPIPARAQRERPRDGGENHADILVFLHDRVGEISQDARRELMGLVARYGAVKVALTLADVSRCFDRSLALVHWVGRRLEQSDEGQALTGDPLR
ncbi:MAG: S1 RNA-binding domain-containing protein [Thermaerobacterales bacterium]